MSGMRPRQEWLVALSLTIYETLLVLYPRRFRRAYAAEMTRVFRDNCRAAAQRSGAVGLAGVWRVTLGDLVITALAERVEQDVNVTRSALYRATSLISLIGVAAWIVDVTGMLLELEPPGRLNQAMASMTLTVQDITPFLLPVIWISFAIGFIGLYVWLSAHRGALVWIPGAFAITALIAMSAMLLDGAWFVLVFQAWAPDPLRIGYYLGFLAIGLALLTSGLMTLSTPALRGASRALVLMGVFGVAFGVFGGVAYGVLWYTRDTGLASEWVSDAVFYFYYVFTIVWLGGWSLLGYQLWRAGAAQEPAVAAAEVMEE